MNAIEELIESISIDKKQQKQIRLLFDMAFLSGIAFKSNYPLTPPRSPLFPVAFEAFLIAGGEVLVNGFKEEMKAYEKGEPTEL